MQAHLLQHITQVQCSDWPAAGVTCAHEADFGETWGPLGPACLHLWGHPSPWVFSKRLTAAPISSQQFPPRAEHQCPTAVDGRSKASHQ